jgi:hypothetical protein
VLENLIKGWESPSYAEKSRSFDSREYHLDPISALKLWELMESGGSNIPVAIFGILKTVEGFSKEKVPNDIESREVVPGADIDRGIL